MTRRVTVEFERVAGEIAQIAAWLGGFSPEGKRRFAQRLQSETARLAVRIERGHRPTPDDEASTYYARPTFRHQFRTGKAKAKRSSVGLWNVLYWLEDTDGDRIPEMLVIVAIRHAAARPLSVEDEGDEESDDSGGEEEEA